jgi:small subunit ribosomal protein S7
MPRRREVPKREILPDPKYGSVDLSKFMNVVMESGKKAVAESIIYGALEQVEKKAGKDPMEIFLTALNNVKPMVEVKSRRVGGANYQVPVEVRPIRRVALAMRWLKESARMRTFHIGGAASRAARRAWLRVWPTSCSRPAKAAAAR